MSLEHSPARDKTRIRPARTSGHWPLLLRVDEVGFELGISKRRVYQLIEDGKLDIVKLGKSTRIPSASMLRLAAEGVAGGSHTNLLPGGRHKPKAANPPTSDDAARKPKGKSKPSHRQARSRRDAIDRGGDADEQ